MDHEIKGLIDDKNETPNIDYKADLLWNKENREGCLDVIKDILAMANTKDGGRIIFGVRDDGYEFIGISDNSWKLFDVTPVNELLHQFADPTFTCSVIKRIIDGKKVVIIDIPEFAEVPILCKESAFIGQNNKRILRKGAIYIRTAKCSSEEMSSVEEMRSILGRGLAKKSDELFQSIQKLITGKPLKETIGVRELFLPEIKEAKNYFQTNLTSSAGFWEITVHPTIYSPDLIPNIPDTGNILSDSVVRLRGWDFPHINHSNLSNFSKGKQSFTLSESVQVQEAWRIYKSGLFVWKEYMQEDLMGFIEKESKVLFFVSAIYSITEFMLFFKRAYAERLSIDTLHIKLELNGCKDRKLGSGQLGLLYSNYICLEDKILIEKDIKAIDLRASFESVARIFIKEIFVQFNWDNPLDSMIEGWQKKLTERGGI